MEIIQSSLEAYIYIYIQFHLPLSSRKLELLETFYTSWHRNQNKIVTWNNGAKSRRGESRPTLSRSRASRKQTWGTSGGERGLWTER